jgi:hypothetical protein
MDPSLGRVEAIEITNGRVTAAGSLADVQTASGKKARTIDLDGRTVLPGLIDTHPHLLHYGTLQEPLVDITAANSHIEIIERIKARAGSTKAGEWIMTTPVGEPHYFISRSWKSLAEGRLPNRHELDRASVDHPIMIQAWAPVTPNVIAFNTEALRRLGIDENTPSQIGEVSIQKTRLESQRAFLLAR